MDHVTSVAIGVVIVLCVPYRAHLVLYVDVAGGVLVFIEPGRSLEQKRHSGSRTLGTPLTPT
jgi:hypothetical protein